MALSSLNGTMGLHSSRFCGTYCEQEYERIEAMYEAHFGFTEKPFALTPNPKFLYLSRTHQEALAHLRYGLESRVGFIAATGEVGTGKTTILRALFGHLDEEHYRVALIFNPCLTPIELLRAVNYEFGLAAGGESSLALIDELNRFLLEENRTGKTPVLVIDEAQNLSPEVLEHIRLLSNLETDADKLLQIVLVGQPELDELLHRTDLRQLAQRIAVRCRLEPLDQQEVRSYALHRMEVAGVYGELFDPAALAAVHRWSKGLPRLLNQICDRALLCAYAGGRNHVALADVQQAARELDCGAGRGGRHGGVREAVRRTMAGDRVYWLLGTATVVEIVVLIWLIRAFL